MRPAPDGVGHTGPSSSLAAGTTAPSTRRRRRERRRGARAAVDASVRYISTQPDRRLPALAGPPGPRLRLLPGPLAVVGHRPGRVLVVHLGLFRRHRRRRVPADAGRRLYAGRDMVPGSNPQLRRACPAAWSRRRPRGGGVAQPDPGADHPHRGRVARRGGPGPTGAAAPRRRAWRPGGRLPAQHRRDPGRLPRHCEPGGDLVVVRTGVWHPQRDRPVFPGRADGAPRRRRLPLRPRRGTIASPRWRPSPKRCRRWWRRS